MITNDSEADNSFFELVSSSFSADFSSREKIDDIIDAVAVTEGNESALDE
jgi:hypothetical protein